MKLTALITTLALGLGSSSAAMAARPAVPAAEDCGTVRIQPFPEPVYQPAPTKPAPIYKLPVQKPPAYRPGWFTLGGVNHKVDGEMSFRVGKINREFTTLKLQSSTGKALIQRVLIQFANGRTQVVELNKYLNASNPTIMIDLNGRARSIAKVTVIGRNANQSAFSVLAV